MAPFTPLFIGGQEVLASDSTTLTWTSKTWEQTTPYARRDLFLKAADRWRDLVVQTTLEEAACSKAWAIGG
ncbi:hypothetical protein DFH07DRAFT_968849 [Mycena maculata]|uniref:Uncharacterized protein n=1 Tax=Mycena maculata TaxID=230809 RepID=A0AAD7HYJ9_9AGAR|nr:hypothetical protein DFH07DRAFT_968849 [Mycena maculata]